MVFGRTESPGSPSFPESQAKNSYSAKVSVTGFDYEICYDLRDLDVTFPFVQTLPGDRILIVGSRCKRSKDQVVEQNAIMHNPDGSLEARFCLGDGIEHVQADSAGRIWVGYFDEGVFGNFGWGDSGRESDPMGQAGLVCFNDSGKKLWEFEAPAGVGGIDDCYALNVDKHSVWACYHSDFPIVHIDDQNRTIGWTTNLAGPRALAIARNRVLAFGGYGDHQTDCFLLQLGDGRAEIRASVQLKLPGNVDPSSLRAIGRGPLLHLFTPTEWSSFLVPN